DFISTNHFASIFQTDSIPVANITILTFHSVMIYTKKKSLYKSNIHVTQDMTFQNLLAYIFPNGPPNRK
ncbi:5747_t:CDS:1, partial [Dentiscutata heterogama]